MGASELLPLWVMPSLYYTFTQDIPFSTQTVQFVMLDTESLVGGDAGQPDSAPPSVTQPAIDEAQWASVADTLSGSTADWLIVVGHFPVYSAGENGPTPLLVSRLLPLMEAAGVALYLCGHDHQLAHIAPVTSTSSTTAPVVDFVVSGAGCKYNGSAMHDHAAEVPPGTIKFQYANGCGFGSLQINRQGWAPSTLTVSLWDGNGNQLYTFSKPNPRAKYMPPAPPRPPHPPNPFVSRSNKIAVLVGAIGIAGGCVVIFGGLAQAFATPTAPPQARALPPRGDDRGSGSAMERGEKAGLLLQQRGYGGVTSAATRVTNRL